MKKKLVVGFAVYLIIMIGIAALFLLKGGPNYFSYKSYLNPIQEKINNNPPTTAGTDNTSSPGTSSNGLENSGTTKPGNSSNTGSPGNSTGSGNGTTTETYDDINFTRILMRGSRGDDVKKLQYLLRNENLYMANIDGIFGINTYNSVLEYQKKNNLVVDGVAGPNTCSKLVKLHDSNNNYKKTGS
ncbi:peptidoglycan-binding protein [Clostridium sp. YIM B02515]|uniref:Peptidoglycan-binding protein n=1 Tax=Clostridium rhizosphaerae TaxID=2803861 RepID=A0ABS1T6N5_9CLOT|nr:peptidoglycan-binding domain-containing protein [Clostridium rhizosphaerae]MBL4935000.1 peptidoglycan-binding protein [Clostridium rhizosphaerae]